MVMCMNRAVSNSGMEPVAPSRLARLAPLIVLACAQVGTSADNGAFSVAMAEMMRVFGCPLSDVQMASTVYSLMAGTFMLASGLLGMVIGWCRNFRAGLVLAVVGELLCAFSPSIELLIWGGRLMVGLGASLIIPSVLGMVSMLYEGEERKQAYGVIAASAALATIIPIALGILVDIAGFRVTFGVLAAYFVALLVASAKLPTGGGLHAGKFDAPGAVIASLGLFAVMCGLSRISTWGVFAPLPQAPFTIAGISPALPIVGVGLLLLVMLIPVEHWMERAHGIAILPSSFVHNPTVRSGVIAIALPFFYMGAQGLVGTSYYQLVIGLGGMQTALLGIISGVPMLVLAMFVPRKFPQLKPWSVVRTGYVFMAAACVSMAFGVRASELTPSNRAASRVRRVTWASRWALPPWVRSCLSLSTPVSMRVLMRAMWSTHRVKRRSKRLFIPTRAMPRLWRAWNRWALRPRRRGSSWRTMPRFAQSLRPRPSTWWQDLPLQRSQRPSPSKPHRQTPPSKPPRRG